MVALDGEDGEIRAAHPEIWLEAICAEQAAVGKILRSDEDADGAEQKGKAAAAEFAGDNGGLHDQQRRSQRRDETDAAERIAEDGAAEVDEKRDQRRLVNVAPGEMIAAGDVVEFVAEVAVAIVEVEVK